MPLNTGFGVFSTGVDVKVDITLPDGTPLILSNVTSFDTKPDQKPMQSEGIDGVTRFASPTRSWSGSFDVDRADSNVDRYFAALEAAYFGGQTIKNVIITQTIREGDGSTSQFRFEGCSLEYNDAGSWKGSDYVKQKISFKGARRKQVI